MPVSPRHPSRRVESGCSPPVPRSCRSSCAERSPRHPTSLAPTPPSFRRRGPRRRVPRSKVRSSLLTTSATTPISTRSPNRASTVTSSPATTCSCERPSTLTTRTTATRAPAGRRRAPVCFAHSLQPNRAVIRCRRRVLAPTLSSTPWPSPATPAIWRRATSSTASPTQTASTGSTATRVPVVSRRTPAATARR